MFNNDYANASAGIISPQSVIIPKDTTLFRFGNSQGKFCLVGPWWFDAAVMARLQHRASQLASRDHRGGSSLEWLALNSRMLLAIKLEFSAADVLLSARATANLQAYQGVGKPMNDFQEANDPSQAQVTYTMVPRPWAVQIYLRDIGDAKSHLQILAQQKLPVALEREMASPGS